MEDQVDAEMRKLETMDEDDLEALKKRRIEMMKKQQEKKQEWLAQGHGEYSEIPEEKVRPLSLMEYNQCSCNIYYQIDNKILVRSSSM